MRQVVPSKYAVQLVPILTRNIRFTNNLVVESLGTSGKTALNYMRALENANLISSVRIGRRKIYINQILLRTILGVDSYGA